MQLLICILNFARTCVNADRCEAMKDSEKEPKRPPKRKKHEWRALRLQYQKLLKKVPSMATKRTIWSIFLMKKERKEKEKRYIR